MKSRYFLHLRDRTASVVDHDGIDADDDDAAAERAAWVIRDVVANDILAGLPIALSSYVSINDVDGTELRRIFFRDVIRFVDDNDEGGTIA